MDAIDALTLCDPLSMDIRAQWDAILPHVSGYLLRAVVSMEDLVDALTYLLYDARYTLLIASKFRPILFILCARWLEETGHEDAKFIALASLISLHEELYPILSEFIRNSYFSRGPLCNLVSMTMTDLHRRFLAYYRILMASPHSPAVFQWPSQPLLQMISSPSLDRGARCLAVHCYALHTRLSEAQREELQLNVLGPSGKDHMPIDAGVSLEGETQWYDGWLLPVMELSRIRELRRAMLDDQGFYDPIKSSSTFCMDLDKMTRRVTNIQGIVMLKDPTAGAQSSELILTPTTQKTLRALAIRLSLRLPTLISSPPSGGKSVILRHLASLLLPACSPKMVIIHLSDTSLDAKSLFGSYVASTIQPGSFVWQEGVIVKAMRHGLWLVLEDIDRASSDVLGALIPLIESLSLNKPIGAPAWLDVPGHGRVDASASFAIFATRSIHANSDGRFPIPTFLGCNKFFPVDVPMPTADELVTIISGKFPKFNRRATRAIIHAWADAKHLAFVPGIKEIGIHELETWCRRIETVLPNNPDVDMDADEALSLKHIYPHVGLREEIYIQARDIFFGSGAFSALTRAHITALGHTFANHLGLTTERAQWVVESRLPEYHIEHDGDGRVTALRIGKVHLPAARVTVDWSDAPQRPFAMHRPALLATERIGSCIANSEPVLLVGETGTGKTTLVSHIASRLHRKLVSLNLSHQTESSDLLGGFKPVDARIPAGELQQHFLALFSRTFSRRKNSKFEDAVRKAVNECKWKRSVELWKECTRLALDKVQLRTVDSVTGENDIERRDDSALGIYTPRKRRKVDENSRSVQEADWTAFLRDVDVFEIQHVRRQGKYAFGFVEGPLVQALKHGYWVLLDEINLASSETLECISSILEGPTASVVLTEQGSFAPVPRHQDFRLFACMNPATDVGKKDLPPNIRSRFTEIHITSPDADQETLLAIVRQYIGHCCLADKSAIFDVAEFYREVRKLAGRRELADGSNHHPHFSVRTLARALTFTSDVVQLYGLRRALWEGCLMAFTMALDERSLPVVKHIADKHLLVGVKNVRSLMAQVPPVPGGQTGNFERIGSFWLERGSLEPDPALDYILTPSVQAKLMGLARVVLARRFPVLIEGPTSSGKTSAIEYLARRTGHRFVRVNNHEHTDIQEYLGTYVSDSVTGKLVFHDGILVRALRNGDWIVLDELNLAPTDVLEALNRLLDDNRELIIPETQEVVRPHPHFMLFATQNPPGLYAGRKILSRAFRNRFLEIHFDDVPQSELQTILSERCRIPESYASRIVAVFQELSKRRQAGRIFESKHGFATLRDLFRWAGREATSTRQLAENGYMLLAERARRPDDKEIVREVIESVMKERIDPKELYDSPERLGLSVPFPMLSTVVWTSAMKRLYILVAHALKYNEPVLLVGETGSGKTSVCQIYADATSKHLTTLNCHQSTETADLIGSQRPLRNRLSSQTDLIQQAKKIFETLPEITGVDDIQDVETVLTFLKRATKLETLPPDMSSTLRALQSALQQSKALFEWHDGPLVRAMRSGELFLLDEISLADDSVLERVNSVLEPARSIVLAERGGFDAEHALVTAHPDFKLIATMNPGGDYGKKELSPALRNRFTEIWVPSVDIKADLRMIIDNSWHHDYLHEFSDHVLAFSEWLASAVGVESVASLRDLLAWVSFTNFVLDSNVSLPASVVFHHAAHLVFLDGLETSSATSSWSIEALDDLRKRAKMQLEEMVPLGIYSDLAFDATFLSTNNRISVGLFSIPKGPLDIISSDFSLQAPTTLDNVRRLVRACQLPKPILLEGNPGVGKTSLVAALGDISGHRVCRINLSDQTDIVDLFGSDFPVEGGRSGEFVWKDAAFLQAMQNGDWVLLDEMNLAPQTVLEGLNAVLDHRGTVFIPELGRSFTKHPQFRIFAAQNPLYQGGGRKGLPKSFLDRFTKVTVQTLTFDDLVLICQNLFPALPPDHLRSMVLFNFRLHVEISVKRAFGREGGPWEFNLRDIMRWGALLINGSSFPLTQHPSRYFDALYLQRFRTDMDRARVTEIFCEVFDLPLLTPFSFNNAWGSVTSTHAQFGSVIIARGNHYGLDDTVELQSQLRPLAAASVCIQQGWLMILSGTTGVGKTQFIRYLAAKAGRHLREFSMSSGVDTADILGNFEQVTDQLHGTSRFEWVDGPLVQAIRKGDWMIIDNANLCNPSILDRLNSLCETNGSLILTERGQVDGVIETLKPHSDFRLICIVDPHNGDLSRAMRNRAIEIHLLNNPLTQQDGDRVLDVARVPPLTPEVDSATKWHALCFELVRRGDSRFNLDAIRPSPVHSSLLTKDSIASSMLDYAVIQEKHRSLQSKMATYAWTLYTTRALIPPIVPIFRRWLGVFGVHLENEAHLGPKKLFDEIEDSPLWNLRHTVGDSLARTRAIPASFISAQPFDLMMNPGLLAEDHYNADNVTLKLRVLSMAIELLVHVYFCDHSEMPNGSLLPSVFHDSRLSHIDQSFDNRSAPGVSTVFPLYLSTMAFARTILQTLSLDRCHEQLSLLKKIKELVDFAEHLRKTACGPHFDFTSARVISQWFHDVLSSSDFLSTSPVSSHAYKLADEVALASGHGMQKIWRIWVISTLPENLRVTLSRLDHLAARLESHITLYDTIREDVFNAMSLLMLNPPTSLVEQQSLTYLCQDVEHRILSKLDISTGESVFMYSSQLAILELEFIWRALSNRDHQALHRWGSLLVKLATLTVGTSLPRLTRVQHCLWMLDNHEGQPLIKVATLLSMVREWMLVVDGMNNKGLATERGADTMLRPIVLNEVLDLCLHDQPLYNLESLEKIVRLQGRLLTNQCQGNHTNRLDQIAHVWAGIFMTLADCYRETYSMHTWKDIHLAASEGRCNDLTTLICSSSDIHLAEMVRKHLANTSIKMDQNSGADESERAGSLGKAWVNLGLLLLELYVPNIPLDPIAAQKCTFQFWQDREAEITANIVMHRSAEDLLTGNVTNPILQHLEKELNEANKKLQEMGSTVESREVDVSALNALFGEIIPFLTQVVYTSKFSTLISDLEGGNSSTRLRAQTIQATILGFITRLESGYVNFADIVQPISTALAFLNFGLSLLKFSTHHKPQQAVSRIYTLVGYPTIAAIEAIPLETSVNRLSCQQILLKAIASAYDVGLKGADSKRFNRLEDNYRELAELWLEDLGDQERDDRESQSLYRHKALNHNMESEADTEEQEFRAIFPSFEVDGSEESLNHPVISQSHTRASAPPRVSTEDKQRIYRLHLWIINAQTSEASWDALYHEYHELRNACIRGVLSSDFVDLPHSLDQHSLPYQIRLLSDASSQLVVGNPMTQTNYNFYHDSNIPEVRKALRIVRTIQQRLGQLIKDWPDQMVLHHLMERCEAILRLKLQSSIAKVLSALEQLVLQMEDWEMYSNRENTLRSQQAALTELIVYWRRLELSCWSRLLEAQYVAFSASMPDWWFRLYELTIRGTLAAAAAAAANGSSTDSYVRDMVPLLEQFIATSPVGQFATRLKLLQSFAEYSRKLSYSKSGSDSDALARASRILQSLHSFYDQFSTTVSKFLAERRAILEKELVDYIKLASWRDVNVHALKHSAQKTHRQLFKCVRRFRELLRESLAPIISDKALYPTLRPSSFPKLSSPIPYKQHVTLLTAFPNILSMGDMPRYMVELHGTFARFDHLLNSQGGSLLQSLTPELVDMVAGQISEAVTELSSSTDAAGTDIQKHKTLLMRKRKAWIDLLQELKRAGLSSKLKPEVLRRQQDNVWLLDRHPITFATASPFHHLASKAEDYLNRVSLIMPELRLSLSSHHADLTTRELDRAVTFVESSFAISLNSRARFARDYYEYHHLNATVQRLESLSTTENAICIIGDVNQWLELCCKVEQALGEISSGCQQFTAFEDTPPLPRPFLESLDNHLIDIRQANRSLTALLENWCATRIGLVTAEERGVFDSSCECILSTLAKLERWEAEEPRIRHLCNPVHDWLFPTASRLKMIPIPKVQQSTGGTIPHKIMVERLLLIVQNLTSLQISLAPCDPTQPVENYISECHVIINNISRAAAIATINEGVSAFVDDLAVSPPTQWIQLIKTVTPFLQRYLRFVEDYLHTQVQFVKASFKLSYVLCRVVLSLAQKGFCKPSALEEESQDLTGESNETQDGVGLGMGTGTENVSNQIEDESQVEGLRDEGSNDDQPQGTADDDGIEMTEDVGGEAQNIEGDENDKASENGSQPEVEEEVGDVDPTDPSAVDEKFWNDGNAEGESAEERTSKEGSKEQIGSSEVVAKEEQDEHKPSNADDPLIEDLDRTMDTSDEEVKEEHSVDAGKQMDDFVPEAQTLDLPDDLDLTTGKDGDQDETSDPQEEPMHEDESMYDLPDSCDHRAGSEELHETPPSSSDETILAAEEAVEQEVDNGESEIIPPEESLQHATAQPDVSASNNEMHYPDEQVMHVVTPESQSEEVKGGPRNDIGTNTGMEASETKEATAAESDNPMSATDKEEAKTNGTMESAPLTKSPSDPFSLPNPLRSLGDTLQEIRRRWENIGDAQESNSSLIQQSDDVPLPAEVEYQNENADRDHGLQALGPAREDQVAKLSELQIKDDEPSSDASDLLDDVSGPVETHEVQNINFAAMCPDATSKALSNDMEVDNALTHDQIKLERPDHSQFHDEHSLNSIGVSHSLTPGVDVPDEHLVELAVRKWQESGHSDSSSGELWRMYDSLTRDLSFALCEQLRLILEPTLATRLRGDYRTGKRLNMKKIIPYIASEYTKDKIWLRRTRPSQREYQVLIALDDSRSMAESRSVHLAYETLALVSKALNRLESGEVAIARFGESVELVHSFEDGMVGDREGEKVMRKFRFEQRRTDILGLVETSLKFLTQAREQKAMGHASNSAADLWQLEIIISDGICQDHEKLRTVLRKAEEQRVMIVFVVIDSLHASHDQGTEGASVNKNQNSILSMNQVSYKDVGGGRMELQLDRYLDTFPFQYYVVLRNVDALPDVLSGTLKQFFERISEE